MILAVDVGGTKMAAGLVAHDGTVTGTRRIATPQGADAETLWQTLADLIAPLAPGAEGVGVGCGGPLTWPDGTVSPLNIPGWRGFPLRARLAALLPGLPVRLHNDAVCLAVAEHWLGAGRGSTDMLGMVVSTGVGGGLILGGRLHHGRTGNAGHIGHVVVEPAGGPRCGCGGHGCLEAIARGPALVTWALSHGWTPGTTSAASPTATLRDGTDHETARAGAVLLDSADGGDGRPAAALCGSADGDGIGPAAVLRGTASGGGAGAGAPVRDATEPGAVGTAATVGRATGCGASRGGAVANGAYAEDRAVTARQLAADAQAGDVVAARAMRRAGRALGVALASVTHLCDLDVITIGGGLSQAGEPLFGPLEEALREHARMGFARHVRVLPAALGQDAGLVGAAALLLADDTYWPPQNA
ncbi:Transcriptional regulator/sugar kinase [[Actinomadura] parvosata subsp. kistnae]|uniref:Glucokinase n=1 Tax=[Actinomadura] parvosata subsp. kistnae TaxID=1909395 RepID=A0A1V0AET0_9ACTN|nr:ROK family protein [Nonomuraea sp. ATCC 55076]AQZ68734.1 glucokinase [Nonomuraea sp. ATCC 55076]SPL92772.1 Transcriptional regulator/sugar kinase [Actinomadura parvosata subsp. kistnae]